jgi:hypothetical protein
METLATSPTATRNASSFPFDGLLKPVIFLTNCSDAARISSSVTGGSKLKRVLILRHMFLTSAIGAAMARDASAGWLYLNQKGAGGAKIRAGLKPKLILALRGAEAPLFHGTSTTLSRYFPQS